LYFIQSEENGTIKERNKKRKYTNNNTKRIKRGIPIAGFSWYWGQTQVKKRKHRSEEFLHEL